VDRLHGGITQALRTEYHAGAALHGPVPLRGWQRTSRAI